jgi:hypothetical protein
VGPQFTRRKRLTWGGYFYAGAQPTVQVYARNSKLADARTFDASLEGIMTTGLASWGRSAS